MSEPILQEPPMSPAIPPEPEKPVPLPEVLSETDTLRLQLLTERRARLKAQLDSLALEMIQRQGEMASATAELNAMQTNLGTVYLLGPSDGVDISSGRIRRA